MFVKGDFDPIQRFWAKVKIGSESECWPWIGAKFIATGYGKVCRNYKSHYAHRIAFELTHGSTKLQILHRCDNRLCCNPEHLFLGTLQDNMADKIRKGRQAKGSQFISAKITEEQALEIVNSKETQCELAKRYGIDQSTISRIRNGKRWKHVLLP